MNGNRFLLTLSPLFAVMKKLLVFILFACLTLSLPVKAQFSENEDRKKMWRKSFKRRKNREAFNPYLKKKTKPSEAMAKQNKKDIRWQTKAARKQKRRSKKQTGH